MYALLADLASGSPSRSGRVRRRLRAATAGVQRRARSARGPKGSSGTVRGRLDNVASQTRCARADERSRGHRAVSARCSAPIRRGTSTMDLPGKHLLGVAPRLGREAARRTTCSAATATGGHRGACGEQSAVPGRRLRQQGRSTRQVRDGDVKMLARLPEDAQTICRPLNAQVLVRLNGGAERRQVRGEAVRTGPGEARGRTRRMHHVHVLRRRLRAPWRALTRGSCASCAA